MTVNSEPSVSVVRSLVRNESSYRTVSRETPSDSSEFSRVLHGEGARSLPSAAPATGTGTAIAAPPPTGAAAGTANPAAQALPYNVFGLVTAHGEASVPPTRVYPAAARTDTAAAPPSAESVFGANPWMASPSGFSAGLGAYGFNPVYFATRQTADKVAQLLGGTVVEKNDILGNGGPFSQSQANYMVQLPNGHLVNAGLTASLYTHGWSQAQIDRLLECERA